MLNRTCREFIDVLASREPVPGGGGASALASAVGIALGAMVGELTVGKKKYAEHEAEISNLIFRSQELIQKFDELVTKDAEAFLPLAAAYRMPKSTPEEARAQEQAVQEALIAAAQAPLEIAETCLKALRDPGQFFTDRKQAGCQRCRHGSGDLPRSAEGRQIKCAHQSQTYEG